MINHYREWIRVTWMDSTAEWFECVWESERQAEATIQNFLEHNMDQVASLLRQSTAPSKAAASVSSELGIQSAASQGDVGQMLEVEPRVESTEQEMSETLSELLALQESLNSLLAQHDQSKAAERMDSGDQELLRRKADEKETVG